MLNSKKMNKLQTLKGFRDFLPEDEIKRLYLIGKIRKVCESMGYDPLETPTLEYADTLLGKYGNEADKLLYLFKDRGGRNVGMRYDQTVPTCRVVGQYSDIVFPFRRYQVQNVWRQEKPQKGRYREFLQVDADIFGIDTPLADAEIVQLIFNIYKELGFEKFTIKLNSREILFKLISETNIADKLTFPILQSIDKLDKIEKEGVRKELLAKGVKEKEINTLFITLESFKEPVGQLKSVFNLLPKLGVESEYFVFEPNMVRGLDYYTGTIFEVDIEDYAAGSVLGGGRYNKLIKDLSGKDIPGIGFGLGFDRTLEAMEQFDLLPVKRTVSQVLVSIFAPELLTESIKTAKMLRDSGVNTELYPDESVKLDKQLKYADKKGIPYVVIIGPEEVKDKTITLKNLRTKEQNKASVEKLCTLLA